MNYQEESLRLLRMNYLVLEEYMKKLDRHSQGVDDILVQVERAMDRIEEQTSAGSVARPPSLRDEGRTTDPA